MAIPIRSVLARVGSTHAFDTNASHHRCECAAEVNLAFSITRGNLMQNHLARWFFGAVGTQRRGLSDGIKSLKWDINDLKGYQVPFFIIRTRSNLLLKFFNIFS